MTRQPITKHGRDHRPPGTLSATDPGGHDPIPILFPNGLLYGFGGVDLAVTNPGGLLLRYKMGDASPGPLVDTSGFTGGPHNATLTENTGGSDPAGGAHSTWDGTQAPTFQLVDHPSFGSADDGCVRFNYNQLHDPGTGAFGTLGDWASITYPGSFFSNAWLPAWNVGGTPLRSVSVFFKATAGGTTVGPIIGGGTNTASGWEGWCISFNPSANTLAFTGGNGSATSGDPIFSFGPSGSLETGLWYHVAVTNDGSNNWTMYLNGAVVATYASTYTPSGGAIFIGGQMIYGNINFPGFAQGFFFGEIDEIDCYDVTLTLAQVQAIYAAKGAGEGTTVSIVTIGAGNTGTPGAIQSINPDGSDVSSGEVIVADGAGGTEWHSATLPTVWHTGSGTPASSLGVNGDYYLNSANGEVWAKSGGSWVDQGFTLQGAIGPTGPTGPTGPAGAASQWHDGTGSPVTLYNNGDFYLEKATGEVWEQVSGAWADQGFSILGPGSGSVWWTGAGSPVTLHTDGDFYLEASGEVWKQASGAWVDQGFSLIGPSGSGGFDPIGTEIFT